MVFKEKPRKIFYFEKNKVDFAIYNWFEDKDNDAFQPIEAKINEDAPVLVNKGGVIKEKCSTELDSYREITTQSEKILESICYREIKKTTTPCLCFLMFPVLFAYLG